MKTFMAEHSEVTIEQSPERPVVAAGQPTMGFAEDPVSPVSPPVAAGAKSGVDDTPENIDVVCEEELLEAFSGRR